ncbi:S1C family serine protease [Salsipaludibacter albus]|uniref:S1C family serine protease n=1 Tax=Salsipaludibacter albus TaxID=2849650 RepID=UPI001EE4C40F|nr:trypsin-like peptidase domain-containing protein [Salsipaludibacter albus]MBY5163200.1 trypsin-like peptidase domain-containing protein [Salsipaludibacter albus]
MVLDAYSRVVSEVAASLLGSVASISVAGRRPGDTGGGSAVAWRDDGLLVTSAHVVAGVAGGGAAFAGPDAASGGDGVEAEVPFAVVGTDPLSDLAVLRTADAPVRPATFGDADDLVIGQLVVAVGNPLGYGGSVSAGVVSGLRRSIATREGRTTRLVEDVIQTDAALHPGNSGGALADAEARVVGISTALVGSSLGQGLGLAVPITTTTRRVLDALARDGRVERWFLGLEGAGRRLRPRAAEQTGRREGVEVQRVVPGSPAERAGLRVGDVVLALDADPVRRPGQLQGLLTGRSAGPVLLGVVRGDRRVELSVQPERLGG